MTVKEKLKRYLRLPKKNKVMIETPSAWIKDKQVITLPSTSGMTQLELKKKRKIRIPMLRTIKRLIAAFLLIVNFFISQASLMSASQSQPLFVLFILNSFILVDYLWKTRDKPELPEAFKP